MTGQEWRLHAACLTEDPELFHPVGCTGPAARQIKEAKAVCWEQCPVRGDCLEEALRLEHGTAGGRHGIWGGLTADERTALARSRYRAGHRVAADGSRRGQRSIGRDGQPLVDAVEVRQLLRDAHTRMSWAELGRRADLDDEQLKKIAHDATPGRRIEQRTADQVRAALQAVPS